MQGNSCVYDGVFKTTTTFLIKLSQNIAITDLWLKSEIDECLYHIQKSAFYVCVVISE